MFLPRIPAV